MEVEDIWVNCEFKPNNIYNVDAYKAIKKILDKSIDCIYTDIPYKYCVAETLKPKESASSVNKRICKLFNNELTAIKNGIDYSILEDFARICKKINCLIWCSKEQILPIMKFFVEEYSCSYNVLVWCKTNPTPMCNNQWLPDLEYCLHIRQSGCKRMNDGYENKSKWYVSAINKSDKDLFEHPTIKPLELVKRHLLHVTQGGDIVLDCFLGSGTTTMACKELGRRYIGFELEEKYCEIANNRLAGLSQQDVKLKEQGFTTIFDFGVE